MRAYESGGVEQLRVTHAGGRPGRLPSTQQQLLWADVGRVPTELGYHYRQWSGKLLALHLARHYGLTLSTRQCQRWLSTLPKSELGPSTTDKGTDTTADPSLGTDR